MALTDKLTAIGDAIREKTGETGKYTLDEMASAISGITTGGEGGYDIPDEALTISGDSGYRFAYDCWNWFVENYKNKITTEKIKDAGFMFGHSSKLTEVPFDLVFDNSSFFNCSSLFSGCHQLKSIGKLVNMYPKQTDSMFRSCYNLRYLPEFENLKMDRVYNYANTDTSKMFESCYSLRNIPEDLLEKMYNPLMTGYYYSFLNSTFGKCYTLDEIRGLNPQTGTMTSNMFIGTFTQCNRVKDIIFAVQEDGTPYAANWRSQIIDLSNAVGYGITGNITDYNSGITKDKRVDDATLYHTLKDDPDWFTSSYQYSRYNHDSAVNTINSLPDTSAYLASAGGTNTIKFTGDAGSATDGGAINTLTEEEIAVAVAKGWTVSLV